MSGFGGFIKSTTKICIPDFAEVYGFIGSVFDPDSKDHVHKLKEMDPINFETVTPRNFICEAKITQIHEDRGWYYVLCSKCSNKLYPEQDTDRLIFVCKDDDNITPNFRYCPALTPPSQTKQDLPTRFSLTIACRKC
ncbi:hypothetical protein CASFOL_002371 [Castilleja foliolosa]|uniref:Uncharacterized protein n=1 Tax=Castilleja foliolosa TaxID=1961234 RepID=A0ABD3EHU4_9LAMI